MLKVKDNEDYWTVFLALNDLEGYSEEDTKEILESFKRLIAPLA